MSKEDKQIIKNDEVDIPVLKDKPKRKRIVVVVFILSLLFSSSFVMLNNVYKNLNF